MSDAELLEAWRGGDASAGNALLERHFTALFRFFRNKVDGDLDDLVQIAFMKCAQGRGKLVPGSNFRAYLFAIARNVVADHYQQAQRRPQLDLQSVSVADLGATPTMALRERQEHRLLLAGLRSIPLDDQVALELMYWEQLTGGDIAQVLGIPEGSVRTRIRGAKAKLAAAIEKLASTPEALRSTMDNIERWSVAIREMLAEDERASG